MIAAVVAEAQFVSLSTQRDADQLMSEADAEDGHASHHLANALLCVGHRLRIARPVRQKDAIGLEREYVFGTGCCGDNRHATALPNQASHDVVFDAIVIGNDVMPGRLVLS